MPSHDVRLEHLEALPLAVVRRVARPAELFLVVPAACGTVWEFLRAQGLRGGRNVALYWDRAIRLEAGVEIAAPFEESATVVRSATPAGPAAIATHFGPYGELGAAHDAVQQWCAREGHALAGPCWEVYGHWEEAWNRDPSRIRTDVHYALLGEQRGPS